MRIVRVYTGDDGESHLEDVTLDFSERNGTRTVAETSTNASVSWAVRTAGDFADFHVGAAKQYVFYMTCAVEIVVGDGSKVILNEGDILDEQDATGHGHTTRVLRSGLCAFVRL